MDRLKEGLGLGQFKASNLSKNQNHNKNQSNTENQIQNKQHKHMRVELWPCVMCNVPDGVSNGVSNSSASPTSYFHRAPE